MTIWVGSELDLGYMYIYICFINQTRKSCSEGQILRKKKDNSKENSVPEGQEVL